MKIKDYVNKYDPQNQFDVLVNSYKQIEFAWSNKFTINEIKSSDISNIIISGLGGSAISADLIKNYLGDEFKIPIVVNRNYDLPRFAGKNTLFIASSYSGNTEETISALNQAVKIGCKIICITTGGEVESIAKKNNLNCVKVQSGFQPRYSLGLSFFSLLKVFQQLNLISDQSEIVEKIIDLWREKGIEYSKDGNFAYNFAESLLGFIPVIYSVADSTSAVGYRLKCQFNENSKLHAFHNEIPEMNHNEIICWESFQEKTFHTKIINITDESYHPQIQKRFQILKEIFSKSGVETLTLTSSQVLYKIRLLDLIYSGDWISYYTGVLRGYDPSEIDNIYLLKDKLK
ncbi:MAG TPA: bifunctional phosphoglucose/phosphomannose isomerase [Ignavibacteriales bacterium]|nr:bifunctional phosphoglucose/phosphomannose isomerase [Ignavibacteriales bacterium]